LAANKRGNVPAAKRIGNAKTTRGATKRLHPGVIAQAVDKSLWLLTIEILPLDPSLDTSIVGALECVEPRLVRFQIVGVGNSVPRSG